MTQPNEPPPDEVREPAQHENRDFANIVALVFVVALALGGLWLFNELKRHNEILNCVASGRRNCDEVLHPDAPAP